MDDQKLARLISDALFCHHAGEYGRELELWLEVQAAKPGPEWQHNIALALMNNGRYFEALEMFEKLASLNPQLSRVHNNRAALLVRMGLDLQFVVPVLLQGLTNPEDMTELVRHFVNVCGTIALGFDDRQDEAFDLVAKISAEGLERHSPPDLLEKNKDTFLNMLSAYRRTAAYREALAQGKWRTAESELQAAKTKFESVGLDNFARGISSTARYFELCRNTFEMLERLGGGAQLSADEVRDAYKRLLGRASDLRGTEERGAYLARLSDLLGWFLNGAVAALSFLADPRTTYTSIATSRSIVARLASHSFVDLGQSLTSFLQFVDRQCMELAAASERCAYSEHVFTLRDDAWMRIRLHCNGLTFDFRSIDTVLARDVLKWNQNPADSAKMELQGFKVFMERQAHEDVFVDGNPQENIARALLQAYLRARSYREVPVRGGRADILALCKNGRFLYETKIWRGPQYFTQGLRELEEYVLGENDDANLSGTFYVVLDPTRSGRAEKYLHGCITTGSVQGHDLTIMVVNLNPPRPSTKL